MTTLLLLLSALAALAAPAAAGPAPAADPGAPILLNADFSGARFGFLRGECPAGFEPRVVGSPEIPPLFRVSDTAGVTIEAGTPLAAELRQPLNAGFGRTIRYRAPVAVTGDAVCRLGIVRRESPEDADWSAPATSGECALEVTARADHPGAFLCLRFDVRSTGPATLAVRRIEAAPAGEER